jgi:hypothetical protein
VDVRCRRRLCGVLRILVHALTTRAAADFEEAHYTSGQGRLAIISSKSAGVGTLDTLGSRGTHGPRRSSHNCATSTNRSWIGTGSLFATCRGRRWRGSEVNWRQGRRIRHQGLKCWKRMFVRMCWLHEPSWGQHGPAVTTVRPLDLSLSLNGKHGQTTPPSSTWPCQAHGSWTS